MVFARYTLKRDGHRTPRDGVVRGGGLACASIRHLGIKNRERRVAVNKVHHRCAGLEIWLEINTLFTKPTCGVISRFFSINTASSSQYRK